jgi:hypothetical protein
MARPFAGKTSHGKKYGDVAGAVDDRGHARIDEADGNAERVAEAALSRMEFYDREGRGELAVPLAH